MLFPERRRESKAKAVAATSAKAGLREAVALIVLLAVSINAFGSPASALREYKTGKYDNALKDYQNALEKKKDDPRLHFNAGAAAYKSKNFEEAAKQFDEALNSPDLKLLQQAYYNRGNSRYYLGNSSPDPSKKSETWEEAVKDFESAMKLNGQDADAKFNYEFVKKKLEELKQQQQKNDKNDKNKDEQNKDQQQNKQDQNKQDQTKNDQEKKDQGNKDQQNKQDQAQQNKNSQQQKEQQQKEQAQKDKEKQKQSAEQKKKEQEKEQAQQSSGNPGDKDKQEGQQTYAAGQMTPQQAKQLLDAQKGQEMMLPIKPQGKPRDPSKPLRDW